MSSGDQRLIVIRAALSARASSPDPPTQGVGAALYSGTTGEVLDEFQLAASPVETAPPPVAAAAWRKTGDKRMLVYATTSDVVRLQLYVGQQTEELDPGIGIVEPAVAADGVPPTAIVGFTADGTVVPGSPVGR